MRLPGDAADGAGADDDVLVDVSYNGLPIFGAPYTTLVRAGHAVAAHSVAVCPNPEVCGTRRGSAQQAG